MPAPVEAAMTTKDVWQLAATIVVPFVAAGGGFWLYALQQKERVSCFITHDFGREYDEFSLVGVHNRSNQAVAITRVRYLSGVIFQTPNQGTALDYEDPTDLGFPYMVGPGEIRKLALEESQAARLAKNVGPIRCLLARFLRRSRISVECQTSTGARYRTSAEQVLPWDEQLPWRRGK